MICDQEALLKLFMLEEHGQFKLFKKWAVSARQHPAVLHTELLKHDKAVNLQRTTSIWCLVLSLNHLMTVIIFYTD